MGKFKGTGWKGNLEYLFSIGGEMGMKKIKEALAPEDRELIFGQAILPVSWIEYGAYVRLMLTADRVLGQGDYELIRRAVRHNAEQDLSGIYRIFISLTDPSILMRNAAKVWNRYFDEGVAVPHIENGEKKASLEVTGFSNMPLNHEIFQSEFIKRSLELSGLKNVTYEHPQCLARGDGRCVFAFFWE